MIYFQFLRQLPPHAALKRGLAAVLVATVHFIILSLVIFILNGNGTGIIIKYLKAEDLVQMGKAKVPLMMIQLMPLKLVYCLC
jgi:hypothetical protein